MRPILPAVVLAFVMAGCSGSNTAEPMGETTGSLASAESETSAALPGESLPALIVNVQSESWTAPKTGFLRPAYIS